MRETTGVGFKRMNQKVCPLLDINKHANTHRHNHISIVYIYIYIQYKLKNKCNCTEK